MPRAFPLITLHEFGPDPHGKGFDGRAVRPGIRTLRRLDAAGGAEFSGERLSFSRPFIRALGLIKWGAAQANHDLGLLDANRCALIVCRQRKK